MTVAVVGEVVPGLTMDERARLAELEAVIERGMGTFVEVGNALGQIRTRRLYLETHSTFELYCRERWGYSKTYATQLIQGAKVNNAVVAIATTPIPSEWVARELTPFLGPDGEGAEIVADLWGKVVESVDRTPTAKDVRAVLVAEGIAPDDRLRASSGKVNRLVLIGHVGDRLTAARDRLHRFRTRELGDSPPSASVRKKALEYADWCDEMAATLRAIAGEGK